MNRNILKEIIFDMIFIDDEKLKRKYPSLNLYVGQTIKSLRKKKKLTQKQLANKINVGCLSITRLENGKMVPGIFLLKKIYKVLK